MKSLRYIALLLPLLLAACGYGFGEQNHFVLKPEYRKLAIAGVQNPTTLTWLEPRIRKLLKDEFTNRGEVTWTDNRHEADAWISIRIIKYYRPTTVSGSSDETLQSSAIFDFEATVKSATDDSVLWSSGKISQSWPFYSGEEADADAEVTKLGIRRLADKMSQGY
ncbi:LPS assembly lipoprotein LptE [Pseudodesulfovibrio sp. zrk46]|uniref:LPS assembly lipoprotein LptE n=1 Tax=Pseudodesulfovibrio sp. zrk46 TaxID=2725288 RepID=UPI00144904A0|nr:LPS assembly lipoprotein LptE [Pseudodesulfovibrio sp. zrk46]QJB55438.1 hypothetical protein HFN16_03095 [Pseudodesulfovibrio sp. zrk46]